MAYVMLVAMVITLGVAIVASAATVAIRPARVSEDVTIAVAAAEAGLGDFSARANQQCPNPQTWCSWVAAPATAGATAVASGSNATFAWKVLNGSSYFSDGYIRVASTGRTTTPAPQTRTFIADFKPNAPCPLLCYNYVSQYETEGSALVRSRFPARTVVVSDNNALAAAGLPQGSPSTIVWNAIPASGTGAADICDNYWYADAGPPGTSGRASLSQARGSRGWTQTESGGHILNGQCEVTMNAGASFQGLVYSRDAFLLSNSLPASTGPLFQSNVGTFWGSSSANSPAPNNPAAAYNSQGFVGFTAPNGGLVPATTGIDMTFPSTFTPALSTVASPKCTYVGPTRVRVSGSYAYVTSPLTAAANDALGCYKNIDATVTGTGVVSAKVPLSPTLTIYAQNGAAGSAIPSTNSIFDVASASIPAAPGAPSWSDAWTTWATPTATDSKFLGFIQAAITSSDPTPNLYNIANNVVSSKYPTDGTNYPSVLGLNGLSWRFNDTGTTSSSTSTWSQTINFTSPSSDPMLEQHNKTVTYSATRTVWTSTVTVQPQKCLVVLLGACTSWSTTEPQQTLTLVRTSYGPISAAPAAATPSDGHATFPLASDVTPYGRDVGGVAPGDIYIEGQSGGNLSVAADNDILLTGDLKYANTASDAFDLVALNNVRLYHPVACKVNTAPAGTSAGFCPNDITGLYPLTNVPALAQHPLSQYVEVRAQPANVSIQGAFFALTGSMYTDNYDRGSTGLGGVIVYGGVFQKHHGALGVNWELNPNGAPPSRVSTGYKVTYQSDSNLYQRVLPYVPTIASTVPGHPWTIRSMSTSTSVTAP